jgi:hypothetical protein
MEKRLIHIIDTTGERDIISDNLMLEDAKDAAFQYAKAITQGTFHSLSNLKEAFIAGYLYAISQIECLGNKH